MAYSSSSSSSITTRSISSTNTPKLNLKGLGKNYKIRATGNIPANRSNPQEYAFNHKFNRGWNFLSFPKFMQYTAFEDIFAQQPNITTITTNGGAITRLNQTDTWVGTNSLLTVDFKLGYNIYNAGNDILNLTYLGYPIGAKQKLWPIKNKVDLYSVPLQQQPEKIENILPFNNANQKLRSSGSGSASATTALSVADGDATVSGIAEKQYLHLKAITTAVNTNGTDVYNNKKYVIVNSAQAGAVATGTVLAEGSDTGAGTISAGSHLIGGIAVNVNLTSATYGALINEIRTAILHTNGHNGAILCGSAVTPANGTQTISLTQSVKGTRGNVTVANTIANLTVATFTGGNFGTGSLVQDLIQDGVCSTWIGDKFVGTAHMKPNTAVWVVMNDKPEEEDFRLFIDQGPDLENDLKFQDGRSPYGNTIPPLGEYDMFDNSIYYVQGHWSYWNDGNPDADYPAQPGDANYGYYRLWVESPEWVAFDFNPSSTDVNVGAYVNSDQENPTVLDDNIENAFGYFLTVHQYFHFQYGKDSPMVISVDGTYNQVINLSNASSVNVSLPVSTYLDLHSRQLAQLTSVSADGITLTEGGGNDYTVATNGDITFISNKSATANVQVSFKYHKRAQDSFFKNIDGNEPLENFDAVGVFKDQYCCGGGAMIFPHGDNVHTFHIVVSPISTTNADGLNFIYDDYANYAENGVNALEGFGFGSATITSTVVDGSDFPTDNTVSLTIVSTDGTSKNYLCSNVDDFDHADGVKFNCNQTRANIFTSLKNAINSSDGHNGKITATSSSTELSLTQAVSGPNGNTFLIWNGPTGEMQDTISVTGNPQEMVGFPEFTFNGRFKGGGDGDIPKFVFWDATLQKYFKMKWHHYNQSTQTETKYEYWQIRDGLRPLTLPDASGFNNWYYDMVENDTNGLFEVNRQNDVDVYQGFKGTNRWYLKCVPETEEW